MQYHVGWQELDGESFAVIKIKPVLKGTEVVYKIVSPPGDGWRRCSFETATTGMKDWIGKIREFTEIPDKDEILCQVQGVYDGRMRTIPRVKLRTGEAPTIGQRVMVTEHLNVAGGFDMLATTKRILDLKNPNLNFVNVGWTNEKESRFIRVDPYTGEEHVCKGEPVR